MVLKKIITAKNDGDISFQKRLFTSPCSSLTPCTLTYCGGLWYVYYFQIEQEAQQARWEGLSGYIYIYIGVFETIRRAKL